GLTMSSCSGPGVCGGARRRPPPPPEPALSLAADLSELSLDQVSRLSARPEVWKKIRAAGPLEVTAAGAQLLAATFRNLTHLAVTGSSSMDARALAPLVTDL
ncbi:hypothetical protein MSG28_011788, partial [Choristoneura fumiferana]